MPKLKNPETMPLEASDGLSMFNRNRKIYARLKYRSVFLALLTASSRLDSIIEVID